MILSPSVTSDGLFFACVFNPVIGVKLWFKLPAYVKATL